MIRLTVLLPIGCVFFATAVHAGGSLGLDEVLAAVAKAPKLVEEIQAELDKNNLKVANVVCWGSRFGNHWTYLGGGRSAPYDCEIGKRTVTIEADLTFFDRKGRSLGDVMKAHSGRAKTFKQTNFRWTWESNSQNTDGKKP